MIWLLATPNSYRYVFERIKYTYKYVSIYSQWLRKQYKYFLSILNSKLSEYEFEKIYKKLFVLF